MRPDSTPTLARAREVIGWYTLRWRVEDHHKTWKKSGSEIERTQLRSLGAMGKWMALHAAVKDLGQCAGPDDAVHEREGQAVIVALVGCVVVLVALLAFAHRSSSPHDATGNPSPARRAGGARRAVYPAEGG